MQGFTLGVTLRVTIHRKAVEQYFTMELFIFQCYPGCNFGKFVNFGLGTIGGERVKGFIITVF